MWVSRSFLLPGVAFLLLGIALSSPTLVAVGAFLLGATLLAQWWARHALDNVRYERLLPENRAFEGETLSLTLRLHNDKLLPVPWLEVLDSLPRAGLTGEEHVSVAPTPGYVYLAHSTSLGRYERTSWPLQLRAPTRGYYRLGPARLRSGDLFGFFPIERDDEDTDAIIVYPKLFTMPELGLPAVRPFGEFKGRERIFEDPMRVAGIRDYQPGDPMRRIDWKASARLQALQSKVYEPSSSMHMLIALNVNTTETTFGFVTDLLERVLSVAGSVARQGIEDGYAVGLVANGAYRESDRPMRIPIGRRSDQLMRILEALAVIGPLTTSSLESVIDRESLRFPLGATLVCVTARMDPPLAASLRRISSAGHIVTVLSLSDEDWREDLGGIGVRDVLDAVTAAEAHRWRVDDGTAADFGRPPL